MRERVKMTVHYQGHLLFREILHVYHADDRMRFYRDSGDTMEEIEQRSAGILQIATLSPAGYVTVYTQELE